MPDDNLTTRVALLEQAIKDIREALRDIRQDIRELRADMNHRFEAMENRQWSQFRWVVGIMIAGYGAILLKLFAH